MLPITTKYRDYADQNAYDTYASASFSEALGATWDETTEFNPTVAATNLFSEDDPNAAMLEVKDANDKYSVGNLRFDAPVLESTAKRLYDAKFGEIKRSEILDKGPKGFLMGAAKFGTMVAATAIDPLNIASAFVPSLAIGKVASVLKMAEPAFIAGRGGTIGARAAGGALEGAVGAAMLEPLPYMHAKKNQLDYDMGDSLLNITVGGVLGGGLHALARGLEIRGENIHNRKVSELSAAIDSLPTESKHRLLSSAFTEISQGRFPVNAANMLAREIIAAQPHGLTDFTFRIDGSLSMENQSRLMKRAGSEAVASIPVQTFDSRAKADEFVRTQGDRSKFLTQKAGDGYVVTEIKPASMVRDALGVVRRFNSHEEATAFANQMGDAQAVGFVKEKGKAAQEFVVVKGISPDDAKRLQSDASYAEFYDPNQGKKGKSDTTVKLKTNGIELADVDARNDMSNDLFIEQPQQIPEVDYGKADGTVESMKLEADTAIQMLNDLYPEMSSEYSDILDGVEEALAEAKVEAQGWKYLGNCMLRNQ